MIVATAAHYSITLNGWDELKADDQNSAWKRLLTEQTRHNIDQR